MAIEVKHGIKPMKTIIASIIIASAILSRATPAEDREWATRVSCELQTAGAQSLPLLTFQQGATPLLSLDQYRSGRAVDAATNGTVEAVFTFGPSATNQYFVAVTNYAAVSNGYLVQLPTVGTNTANTAWWYTAYFTRSGKRYWTGNGRLNILATTSSADGLVWQEITSGAEVDPIAQPVATNALAQAQAAQSTASAANVAATNAAALAATAIQAEVDPVAYPVATNALALAEGALQPPATNGLPVALAHAESAHGLTDNGGFAGGTGASASTGGAVGAGASATYGGAVGAGASATYGGAVGAGASATYGGAVGAGATATTGGAVGAYASATYGGAVGTAATATTGGAVGNSTTATTGGAVGSGTVTSSGFAGGYQAIAALGDGTAIDAIQLGTGRNPDANTLQIYDHKLLNADGSIPSERMAATLSGYATTGAVAAVQAEVESKADAETVVSGAVGTASAGNRYFWTSATNVVFSVNLTSGQVVNLAKLNNTGTTSITAIGAVGWVWTGGDMVNTIPAGKSMTFGFLVDAATGKTNAYATGVSK